MKVLLVRPPRIKQAITLGEFMYSEPIGLEMVYTMLHEKHDIEIFDLMTETKKLKDKLREYNPEIVGITSLCIDVFEVIKISEKVKKYNKDIITFVGGTQTFLNSEAFFVSSIDHIMKYTTSENINELLYYLEKKEKPPKIGGIYSKVNNFETIDVFGINEYVHPNRESTAKYRKFYSYFGYRPCAIMTTAQGCSKTCRFCLRWRIEGAKEKYLPIKYIKNELLSIKEKNIMIFDNDFLHNGERLADFCNILEDEKINKNFICYASVHSILKNKDVIRRFEKLGLKAVLVGYESFNEKELEKYQKKTKSNDNVKASKFLKEIGLDVWASFILHPDWSVRDFKEFRKYIRKLNPEISTFSPLTPFPNLELYKEYKDRLIFKKEDYEKWSFGQVTIEPSKMSLKRYYYETVKSILYVNLCTNNIIYMSKKFGFLTIVRLFKGSMKVLLNYIKLMIRT